MRHCGRSSTVVCMAVCADIRTLTSLHLAPVPPPTLPQPCRGRSSFTSTRGHEISLYRPRDGQLSSAEYLDEPCTKLTKLPKGAIYTIRHAQRPECMGVSGVWRFNQCAMTYLTSTALP